MSEPVADCDINVCRANLSSPDYNVLDVWSRYTLRGETYSRLTWPEDGVEPALFDRAAFDRRFAYPLLRIKVRLYEATMDVERDDPLAEASTRADGTFAFEWLLEVGTEYKIVAVLKNDDANLREERITISGILLRTAPRNATSSRMVLRHRNHSAAAGDVADETEDINASLQTSLDGETELHLSESASLLFNTFMLNVPYINQNRQDNNRAARKDVNIDSIGVVSGGILCFPTSTAMVMRYYGRTANTTESMAEAVYRLWEDASFPHRQGSNGLNRYKFTFGNASGGNVWEWWVWENRTARQQVGLPLTPNWWEHAKDTDGADDLPPDGEWRTYWTTDALRMVRNAAYVRRQMARGWPLVLGTNLTGAGHIVVLRGIVVKNNGEIHKYIVNNPWGEPGPNEDRAIYYDEQTRGQTGARLEIRTHMVVRLGLERRAVQWIRLIHGER
jgi:hypothetical protein